MRLSINLHTFGFLFVAAVVDVERKGDAGKSRISLSWYLPLGGSYQGGLIIVSPVRSARGA